MDFILLFDELCEESEAVGHTPSRYECFLRGALMTATDPEVIAELEVELDTAKFSMF